MENIEGIVSARVFKLLREGTPSWNIDSAGYWSYPALIKTTAGRVQWLFLILGTVPMPQKKRTALFRPKGLVITEANTTNLVRYDNFRIGHNPFPDADWEKPIAMFPHKDIGNLSYEDFEKREAELLTNYPSVTKAFLETGRLPDAFAAEYLYLAHPIVLPYLKHLAPEFVRALGVQKIAGQQESETP